MNLKLWKLTRIWLKQGGCRLFLPATSLIEKIELTKQKVIVNKTRRRLDSYYKSSTAKQLIDFTSIELSPSSSNNIPNDGLIPKKRIKQELFSIMFRNFRKSVEYWQTTCWNILRKELSVLI